jgi:hypothetical protein
MCVCMYKMCVCMYVCNVCIYVCMCKMCVCMCVCMFVTTPSAKSRHFCEQYYPTLFVMEMHSVLGEVETDALSII